jgi:glycerol-3-phosphate dehydrogenase
MTRVDMLIIGAGIHGVTVAYEASRRGRSFCLVDRADFGEGASSNSLKILHGGLRYLQSLDIGRSRESIRARRRLMTIVPHLVRPLRCRLDLSGRGGLYPLLFRAGLLVNDLVTYDRNRGVPDGKRIPGSTFPCWYDAIVEDSERLLMTLLADALDRGDGASTALNHTTIRTLERTGDEWRASLDDEGDGRALDVRARTVVRCMGAHRTDRPVGVSMNLVVNPLELTANGEAVAMSHPVDGRNVFCVPWRGLTMIGTWDRAYPHDPGGPIEVEAPWVDELLAWLAPVHPELGRLDRSRVRLVHAGLLPLARPGGAPLGSASVRSAPDDSIDVVGVKYTTALEIAGAVMGAVDARLGPPPVPPGPESPLPQHEETLRRFERERADRSQPVVAGTAPTRGAIEYAARHERARTLGDVMLRRTPIASAGHPGSEISASVADEMARLLGWSPERRDAELGEFDADWRFAGNVPVRGSRT